MKIVTVIGARPQFIKAAPFSEVFRKYHKEVLVHTGQHYDVNMSEIFFEELNIPKPDYNLGIGSGNHGKQTAYMLAGIEDVLLAERPDGLLVYGDTNSTLAGALAASKLHIPVFHVEAGLRSYNKLMPEEQNRIIADHISDILLCPTQTAVNNLALEGIIEGVYNTGDIMFDAVLRNISRAHEKYANGMWSNDIFVDSKNQLSIQEGQFYLATIHRAENTDDPSKLETIFSAFNHLDKPVLLPLHPRTRKIVEKLNIGLNNVIVIDPVGYLLMLYLTQKSAMVITDSGGLQKEAFLLGTPCTTLRDQTEWVETLIDSWNELSDIEVDQIISHVNRPLNNTKDQRSRPFGDGNASMKICKTIECWRRK